MAHNEDEDMDALLDEAMDIVEEQDHQQKENVEKEKQKLDNDIQKALDELDGNGAENIMKEFQALLSAGADGEINENTFTGFKQTVGNLLSTLEGVSGELSEEDKKNMDRIKELMNVMENNDDEKAQELLAELQKEKPDLANMEDVSKVDFDAQIQQYAESMQKLHEALGENGTAAAPAVQAEGEVPADMANMLLSAILDPQFIEPIKVMRDSYGPWLESHQELSSADRERYTRQYQKTIEISDFLRAPVDKEDTERIEKLLHMMHEFSELGEPPQDLATFAKKGESGAAAPA